MTFADFFVLLPLIVPAVSVLVVLLAITLARRHAPVFGLTLLGFLTAFITLPFISSQLPREIDPLFIIDFYALFYLGLLLLTGLGVTVLAYSYLAQRGGAPEELYLLLLIATLGSATLVISRHFIAFFLGLETLTVALYTLIAYHRTERNIEAGLKYLVLAAVSTAFLLFGMALLYAELGTMDIAAVMRQLATQSGGVPPFLLAGLGLITVGFGFKLAVVPFHMWTPDIYEGASAPVAAFVATVSKGGMFALLLRYFVQLDLQRYPSVFVLVGLLAAASMFGGNLLALLQQNVKRILAYSSIAHFGYLLVALLAGDSVAVSAVGYYLAAYFITILGAFSLVAGLSHQNQEAEQVSDFRGLFWQKPWLAGAFTAALLSLAGIPLTAGFIGKFFVLAAGAGSGLWLLVILLIAASAIGLFYYLRIVVMMGLTPPAETAGAAGPAAFPLSGSLLLSALTLLLIGLGVYPAPLLALIQQTISSFG